MGNLLVQGTSTKKTEEDNISLMSSVVSNSYRQLSCEDELKFRNNQLYNNSSHMLVRMRPESVKSKDSSEKVDHYLETYDIIKFRLYIYFNTILIFLLIGAAIFYSLEGNISIEKEQEYNNRCKHERNQIKMRVKEEIEQLAYTEQDKTIYQVYLDDELNKKIQDLVNEMDQCHRNLNITKIKTLSFIKSFSFVYSIMSTVGYGDVVPLTISGKLFLVFFSIITIPCFITFYIEFSEIITIKLIKIYTKIYSKINRKIEIIGKDISSTTLLKDQETHQTSKAVISLSAFLIVIFVTCALHYQIVKNTPVKEDFISSLLFVFESIALIGLGYNVPEDTIKYIFIELPFIIIGVSFFGLYINIIVNFLRHTLPTFISKKYPIKGFGTTSEKHFIDYILKRRKVKFTDITSDYRSDVYLKNNLEACMEHYS
ncbi:Two pore domain potassium channel family and Two pore domain potassium channel domain-containing protein [Strongyloides ratti]|uniref:Two pore domain potassium channel family and Two pore domain potassium channel domain-containing protein n=1 Tax=Strongyloides ratti TaxID=34506 RepID=A0A090LMD9_STRRB|nr:Two pore domain potassium channel family and Two pore domain potassium channel domain-containing protein [Strongyloides ratti]CEF69348.1 Two pore domain potassium channel family and Two pore domain potassium channel domain-containing protein [Strongyloides ratti]